MNQRGRKEVIGVTKTSSWQMMGLLALSNDENMSDEAWGGVVD